LRRRFGALLHGGTKARGLAAHPWLRRRGVGRCWRLGRGLPRRRRWAGCWRAWPPMAATTSKRWGGAWHSRGGGGRQGVVVGGRWARVASLGCC
jgi:hypothetical protein